LVALEADGERSYPKNTERITFAAAQLKILRGRMVDKRRNHM
jgi:hypothetical protein